VKKWLLLAVVFVIGFSVFGLIDFETHQTNVPAPSISNLTSSTNTPVAWRLGDEISGCTWQFWGSRNTKILGLLRRELTPLVCPGQYDEFERDMETCTTSLLTCGKGPPPSWEILCSSFMGSMSQTGDEFWLLPSQENRCKAAWYLCVDNTFC